MKKAIALMLALALAVSMAACGEKAPAAAEKTPLSGTMEENVNKVMELYTNKKQYIQTMAESSQMDSIPKIMQLIEEAAAH